MCALTLEADAVVALLDHNWEDYYGSGYGKAIGDPNAYSTGFMGRHNVVIAHMAGMGKGAAAAAAAAAANCKASFPNIKLALVVGICGAVPFLPGIKERREIILGDIIVSEGIIQFDFGRKNPDGFTRKSTPQDSLGRPSFEVRGFLAKLKSYHSQNKMQKRMNKYLDMLQEIPFLNARYPGVHDDRLFKQTYQHINDTMECGFDRCRCELVSRNRLAQGATKPAIHFGLMASGDTVMKFGEERDKLAQRDQVLGFEMEGAGVWDNFSSVMVIKGACDYADSHKTKVWQNYAAATAAACTKALLDD
ncbi:hypothetical protein ACHAQJ_004250 [Trichoderma viride]